MLIFTILVPLKVLVLSKHRDECAYVFFGLSPNIGTLLPIFWLLRGYYRLALTLDDKNVTEMYVYVTFMVHYVGSSTIIILSNISTEDHKARCGHCTSLIMCLCIWHPYLIITELYLWTHHTSVRPGIQSDTIYVAVNM